MKLSRLIERLEALEKDLGDCDVSSIQKENGRIGRTLSLLVDADLNEVIIVGR